MEQIWDFLRSVFKTFWRAPTNGTNLYPKCTENLSQKVSDLSHSKPIGPNLAQLWHLWPLSHLMTVDIYVNCKIRWSIHKHNPPLGVQADKYVRHYNSLHSTSIGELCYSCTIQRYTDHITKPTIGLGDSKRLLPDCYILDRQTVKFIHLFGKSGESRE